MRGEICGFDGGENAEEFAYPAAKVRNYPLGGLAQERLQFTERLLDPIEIECNRRRLIAGAMMDVENQHQTLQNAKPAVFARNLAPAVHSVGRDTVGDHSEISP
jgi:hypothetical protein